MNSNSIDDMRRFCHINQALGHTLRGIRAEKGFVGLIMVSLFILLSLPVNSDAQGQQAREIILGGFNEVPRVATPATGIVHLSLEADTLIVSGNFSDLSRGYYSAGIFIGRDNENGNRIFPLDADFEDPTVSTHGKFLPENNRFTLTPQLKQVLQRGRLYINISSHRRQHGEIRGQIPAMNPG